MLIGSATPIGVAPRAAVDGICRMEDVAELNIYASPGNFARDRADSPALP